MLYNYNMSNETGQKSKKLNVKPTMRQRKAFARVVENGGNKSKAMRDVGYSPETAKTPQKLTESKGWKQLEKEFLAHSKLATVHKEGLEATRSGFELQEVEVKNIETGEMETKIERVAVEVPDFKVRHQYLDTAYKVRGMYPKEQKGELNINIFNLAELAERHAKRKQLGFVDVVDPDNPVT